MTGDDQDEVYDPNRKGVRDVRTYFMYVRYMRTVLYVRHIRTCM